MTQFEIDSFATASGGGGGVVSGAYQLSGIYQVSGDFAYDFAKQVSGLYVTHSGGFYAASGAAGGGGGGTVSGWAQASGFYVEHSGGLYQPSGVYVGASGGLYQTSGIFQTSGVFQTSGIYQVSGDYPLAHTKQASGIYLLTSGGLYQASGVFALSGAAGGGGTSGFIHAGTFLGSGNNSTLLYTLSHGLAQVPTGISVDAASPQARGDIDLSGNASGIFVTYTSPPLSGDVRLSWVAGPSASAGGIISGLFALSGTAGGGAGVSGVVHAATFVGSGDNSNTLYTLSHGLGITPTGISVEPSSPQARGSFDVSGNASGIFVRYPVAPVSGDVKLTWIAGPSDAANIVTIGSGTVHAATFVGSGNASTTTYTLSHGIGTTPQGLVVSPMSPNARGDFDVSGNASGIIVTYPIAPASGDVKLSWLAGPSTLVAISGNLVHGAEFIGSGNNSTTVYTLSHGLGIVPNTVLVDPGSPQARGLFDISGNASGIFVSYTSPPASGTVRLYWQAGPTSIATLNAQSGIYTLTSGSSINGIISGSLTFASGSSVSFSGTTNVPGLIPRPPAWFTIFKSGNTTISQKYDGTILAALSGAPGSVIQQSLNEISGFRNSANIMHSDIYVCDGDYDLESGFNGIDFPPFSVARLAMGRRAVLQVPNQYSGYVFKIGNNSEYVTIEGGYIRENTNSAFSGIGYDWDAFRLDTTEVGDIVYCAIKDVQISRAEVGIHFQGQSGYINSNTFQNIIMEGCKYFLRWDVTNYAAENFSQNYFENIHCQSQGSLLIGADRIPGKRNKFDNVVFWDVGVGASGDGGLTAIVASGATDTIIVGGIMTNRGTIAAGQFSGQNRFQNYGSGTRIFDSFEDLEAPAATVRGTIRTPLIGPISGSTFRIEQNQAGLAMDVRLIPAADADTISYSLWNNAQNERIQVARTGPAAQYNTVSQRVSTSGIVGNMVFRMIDSVVTTTIENMRLDSSGNVEFNRSGGTVQFKSGNTSLTRTETAAMSGAFSPLGFITARLGTSSIKIPYFAT